MRDVLRQALVLAGSGIALGSVSAWILSRALTHLSAAGNAYDPGFSVQGWLPLPTFAGAAVTFALVALVAASVPALRATRISPIVALTST
jgi:ABC-type antimicrobial peptide transport system permease subunit